MGHLPAFDEATQHGLDDRTQRAVLLGETVGLHAEEFLDVMVEEMEQR
jgi:hypothetical protein